MKSVIFWDMTPCSPLKPNRHSRETCRLHRHGLKVSEKKNSMKQAASKAALLGLLLNPEDGSDMFLRNVG
jgi:hypothetical protein